MIIDPSAVMAILRDEADGPAMTAQIRAAVVRRMSAPSYVELAAVVDGRHDPVASAALDATLTALRIEIIPFSAGQARLARTAYQRYGRGSGHPARLNMGDCFSYALARDLGEPLLFKGSDFALTDIEVLVEPIRERRLSEVTAAYRATS